MADPRNLLSQILECTTDCVFTVDLDWRFTFLNSNAIKELAPSECLLGTRILDAYPQLAETPFWPAYQRAMTDRRPQHIEAFMPGFDSWYEVNTAPTEDGIAVFFSNVDTRKKREAAVIESEERLRKTLDHIPQMVWTADSNGRFENFNGPWYDFTGLPRGAMAPKPELDVFHPDDRSAVIRNWIAALAAGLPYEDQYRLKHQADGWRWVISRAWPEKDSAGKVICWYGTCTDVHEEALAKQALQASELLYRSVLEASADCIKIITADGRLEFMNKPGCELLQVDDFEVMRGRVWAELWPHAFRAQVSDAVETAKSGTTVRFSGFCPTTQGVPKWWNVVLSPMIDSSKVITKLLCISRDITDERARAEEVEWASEHDSLTGLPNRRSFIARLQASVLRSMNSGSPIGLLLLDLDHFKHVNDTLGHAAGDELLHAFTGRLKSGVRSGDFVARLGGDEFAIIIENVKGQSDLLQTGSSILSRLATPIEAGTHSFRASASIGGAIFPQDASSAAELMTCADTAMYALKAAGRGGTKLFEAELRQEVQRVASQMNLGRVAINESRIIPYYQPKVDLASGRTLGYEALLRWTALSGLQLPSTVAESFKNYEMAAQMGEAMQRQVLQDIASGQLLGHPCTHVAINAAPAEFLRDDYSERLLKLVEESGVRTSSIQVEVTEHVFVDRHSCFVKRALQNLHENGVLVALDDFGTGYSSLSHLRDFPVDVLKVDMTFIQRMCENAEIHAIVSAVIDLAHSLRIQVVAEGVETEEQRKELIRLGCTIGQGYLFGRPAPFSCVSAASGIESAAA